MVCLPNDVADFIRGGLHNDDMFKAKCDLGQAVADYLECPLHSAEVELSNPGDLKTE